MTSVGYEFVRNLMNLHALPPGKPAQRRPVTKLEVMSDHIAVPVSVAPAGRHPVEHLLFALKHEGVNLGLLMEALHGIEGDAVRAAVEATPTGQYARTLGFLWEQANQGSLDVPMVAGPTVDLFDPKRYVTGTPQRNAKWKVNFNGLGSMRYCATVQRTPVVTRLLAGDIPKRANAFAADMPEELRNKALAWAYLDETTSSYAIEHEVPSDQRARAFVALLHRAHKREDLTEDYLVSLQQAVMSNPYSEEASFRVGQNWLQSGLRGASGVSYVPPPPGVCRELMDELMAFANAAPDDVPAMVRAAVVSFGFVYIHPFHDGNGRLSRFLYHHALCRAGALDNGLILPVSAAMKKHEREYRDALVALSEPLRSKWSVQWADGDTFDFQYLGDSDHGVYRYWDATKAVEFCSLMAEQALNQELREEVQYLVRYDRVVGAINATYDVVGSTLSTLVRSALENDGRVSKRRRDQFPELPSEIFDAIEAETQAVLAAEAQALADPSPGGKRGGG